MTELTISTHVVGDGDDAITYDIQGYLDRVTTERPALFLFGAPMGASGFRQLAEQFPDRAVVTYDPRGAGRNPTGTADITTEQHVDDIHRVIAALGTGPVDAFGTSGGAVNLLAAASAHPQDYRLIVAHEPPSAPLLGDGDEVLAIVDDMKCCYAAQGQGAAMARFIALVMFSGPVPAGYLERPAPDPAMFGLPVEDDGSRTDPLFRNMPAIISHRMDVDALRALGDRLTLAAGTESGETIAARAARAIAAAIGTPAADFPSHHTGFHDQPGHPGDPVAFGARLHELVDRP